jgi:TRAP-type C4-dicarboxylate transport system permease small subunit
VFLDTKEKDLILIELKDHLPNTLSLLVGALVRIKTFLVVITLPILPITFFLVVFLRYILEKDLFAYEEWLLMICCWLYFLSSALGTYYDTHINADLLANLLKSPRLLWLRKVAVTLVELIITIVIVYWGFLMLADELAMYPRWKTTIALKIPFLVPRVGIVLGLLFMAFYSALHLFVLLKIGAEKYFEILEQEKLAVSNAGLEEQT